MAASSSSITPNPLTYLLGHAIIGYRLKLAVNYFLEMEKLTELPIGSSDASSEKIWQKLERYIKVNEVNDLTASIIREEGENGSTKTLDTELAIYEARNHVRDAQIGRVLTNIAKYIDDRETYAAIAQKEHLPQE